MKTLLVFILVTCLGVLAAKADGIALAGSEWGFGDGDKPFIQFRSDGRVSGHAGCNRFTGGYTEDGGNLSFGLLAMTQMMCAPADMERERTFSQLLNNTRRFEATHMKLTFYSGAGNALVTLRRRDFE